jgi:hypothetical protein
MDGHRRGNVVGCRRVPSVQNPGDDSRKAVFRRFVTAVLAVCYLVAAVSGIVLFLRPEGSLARWTSWAMIGLDKKRWEALHIVFVVIALTASVAHVWLNWRPLVSSVLNRAGQRPDEGRRIGLTGEVVAALVIGLIAFSAAIVPWQPAAALNGLRSQIKDGRFSARVCRR